MDERRYAEFSTAQNPTPYRILGLRLVPYSLWHATFLARLGLPDHPAAIEAASDSDFLKALLVCASAFPDGYELFSSPTQLAKTIKRWTRKVRFRYGIFPRRLDFESARKSFSEYLADGLLVPRVWIYEDGPPVKLGAPRLLWLKVKLMEMMSEAEALNKHLPLALLEVFASAECHQGRQLLDDGDRTLEEMAEAQEDELNEIERQFNARN